MKKSLRLSLTVILAVVFLFSMTKVLRQQREYSAASDSYSEAVSLASSGKPAAAVPTETAEPAEEEIRWVPAPLDEEDPHIKTLEEMDMEALREVNPDVIGWILIPDTKINYPILQGEDNDFYLDHNWKGTKSSVGSIYLEHHNNPNLTDFNAIIYGHNMKNGSMFAGLHHFRYQKHYEGHPYVYVRTGLGTYRYDIFAAYRADIEGNTYALYFPDDAFKEAFLNNALVDSVIETGVEPSVTDRILTLSTCSGAGYSTRWVVQARLQMVQE